MPLWAHWLLMHVSNSVLTESRSGRLHHTLPPNSSNDINHAPNPSRKSKLLVVLLDSVYNFYDPRPETLLVIVACGARTTEGWTSVRQQRSG